MENFVSDKNASKNNLIFSLSFFFVKIWMEKKRFSVKEWKLERDRFFDTPCTVAYLCTFIHALESVYVVAWKWPGNNSDKIIPIHAPYRVYLIFGISFQKLVEPNLCLTRDIFRMVKISEYRVSLQIVQFFEINQPLLIFTFFDDVYVTITVDTDICVASIIPSMEYSVLFHNWNIWQEIGVQYRLCTISESRLWP